MNNKDLFQVDWSETKGHLTLKEYFSEVKNEIISFIESKAENNEWIKKGELEQLPHYSELPCSLEDVLTYDADIAETFRYYIWKLIQSGEIDVCSWDSVEDIVGAEIGYLTYNEKEV